MNKKKLIRNWHRKKITGCVGPIAAVVLMSAILILANNAAAISVNKNVYNNNVNSISMPGSVSNLVNDSYATDYINWKWTDPVTDSSSVQFVQVKISIDGQYMANVPMGIRQYNATGLKPNTQHTISAQTIDTRNNLADDEIITNTAWTASVTMTTPAPIPTTTPTPTPIATPTPTPIATPTPATPTPTATTASISAPIPGYNLVWSDEFNGPLDPKWQIITYQNTPWMDCFTSDNTYLEPGILTLRMQKGYCPTKNNGFTTGGIRTTSSWLYGYFEARAKLSVGQGTSSSFVLTGHDWIWPPEIDIYETAGYSVTDTVFQTYHYGGALNNFVQGWNHLNNGYFSDDYHVFGMEWAPTYIRWFVDGTETYRVTNNNYQIPNIPMQIYFAQGTGWIGPLDNSMLPQYQNIDYVRVFQK